MLLARNYPKKIKRFFFKSYISTIQTLQFQLYVTEHFLLNFFG